MVLSSYAMDGNLAKYLYFILGWFRPLRLVQ